jgi:hypothetical protein
LENDGPLSRLADPSVILVVRFACKKRPVGAENALSRWANRERPEKQA